MDSNKVQNMVVALRGNAKVDSDTALADRLSLDRHNTDLQQQVSDRLAVIMPVVQHTDTPKADKPKATSKAKAKPKAKAKGQAGQSKGYNPQSDMVNWFIAHVDDRAPVDRANGTVYNAKVGGTDKKLIKTPTFENKGGVFFGAVLNPHLAKVKGLQYHSKSNVYKYGANASKAVVTACKRAIVKAVDKYDGPKV